MTLAGLMAVGSPPAVCVAHAAKPHCRVRQWELVEFAGSGSLARIYRARPIDSPADRPAAYAVKMLRPCWQDDDQAIRLLQREALMGQSLSHPHLAPILAAHVTEHPRLLVMPWLAGTSLKVRLAGGQQFGARKRFGSHVRRPRRSMRCTPQAGCTGMCRRETSMYLPAGTSRCWTSVLRAAAMSLARPPIGRSWARAAIWRRNT